MRLYVLAKSHREPVGGWCAACKRSKARTSKLVVDDEQGKVTVLDVCSGCSGALHETAIVGKKAR